MQTSYRKSTTRKAPTPEQQLASAIENARKNNVHVIGHGVMKADGCKFYLCPSQSVEGMCHVVKLTKTGLQCDCYYSSQRGRVCAHRAAVYLLLKQEAETAKAQAPQAAPTGASMASRAAAALPADHTPETFSIFKTEAPVERRYQTLEDEYAARDGYASSDYYQHAYR